jgi:death-on-curing protein
MGGTSQILTVDDIVGINRRMIEVFGGLFTESDDNLMGPGSLEHALVEAQGSFFGQEPYPTVVKKAAMIGWRIIAGHLFHDGNKRTGIEVCYAILRLNGHQMQVDREAIDIALRIATGEMTLEAFTEWLEQQTTS